MWCIELDLWNFALLLINKFKDFYEDFQERYHDDVFVVQKKKKKKISS